MATGDLTTLEAVRALLVDLKTNDVDEVLADLISKASAVILSYINRTIVTTTTTEYRDGTGTGRMTLRGYPIQSVAAVKVSGQTIPAATPGGIDNGWLISGERELVLRGYLFARGTLNVSITYTFGYDTPPLALSRACEKTVLYWFYERKRIGEKTKVIGQQNITYDVRDLPEEAITELVNVRNVVPV